MPTDTATVVRVMPQRPMTDTEKAEALRTIIADGERLRELAAKADAGMLAFLLENVLHEARVLLIGAGHEPQAPRPSCEHATKSSVVRLPWLRKSKPPC